MLIFPRISTSSYSDSIDARPAAGACSSFGLCNSLWAMSPSDTMRYWRAAVLVRCRRYPRESGGNLRVSRGRERDVPGAQAERRQVCVTAPYPLAEWEAE